MISIDWIQLKNLSFLYIHKLFNMIKKTKLARFFTILLRRWTGVLSSHDIRVNNTNFALDNSFCSYCHETAEVNNNYMNIVWDNKYAYDSCTQNNDSSIMLFLMYLLFSFSIESSLFRM